MNDKKQLHHSDFTYDPELSEAVKKNIEELKKIKKKGDKNMFGFIEKEDIMTLDSKYLAILEEEKNKYTRLKKYCNVLSEKTKEIGTESKAAFPNDDEFEIKCYTDTNFTLEAVNQELSIASLNMKYRPGMFKIFAKTYEQFGEKYLISLIKKMARSLVINENKSITQFLKGITGTEASDHKGIDKALNETLTDGQFMDAVVITNQSGLAYLIDEKIIQEGDTTYRNKPLIIVSDKQLPSTAYKNSFFVGSIFDYISFDEQAPIEVDAVESIKTGYYSIRFSEMYDVICNTSMEMVRVDIANS